MRDQFYEYVITHLKDIDVGGISCGYEVFAEKVGLLTGKGKGISRKCLVVRGTNQHAAIVIGAWDFGKYLALRRLLWMRKLKTDDDYRLKSEDYLRDDISHLFNTVVHLAVMDAVQDLLENTDLDEKGIKDVLKAW